MTKKEISTQRYLFIFVCLAVCGILLYLLRSVLLPFVMGIVLAYFLDPAVNRICRNSKISRTIATTIVMSLFLLILLPIIVLLGSIAIHQISAFVANLPQYLEGFGQKIEQAFTHLQQMFPQLSEQKITTLWQGNIRESFKPFAQLFKTILTNGFAFINILSLLLISPVVAFYMLRDWHSFTENILALVPRKHQNIVKDGVEQINRIISGYLRGQALVCIALGSFYSCGLWLVGLDLGLLVGFIAGLISFIPYVGSISGFLMAIVLVVTQYGTLPKILEVIAVFAVGQFLEGNFLTPKLVGENIGLHPVWVMFALLAGGVLLGLLGMIIAVPVAACIGVFLRFLLAHYKKSAVYLEK